MEGQIEEGWEKSTPPCRRYLYDEGMSAKVASATYHIAASTPWVWKRMWRVAKTNEPEKAIQEGQGKIHYRGSSKLKEQVVAHMKKEAGIRQRWPSYSNIRRWRMLLTTIIHCRGNNDTMKKNPARCIFCLLSDFYRVE